MTEKAETEWKEAHDHVHQLVYEGKGEVKDVYNEWAKRYEKDMILLHCKGPLYGALHLAKEFKDKKDANILDVAAGTGLVAKHLRQFGFKNIDGLDASQEMLQVAKEKELYNNYICAMFTAERLDIETDKYDAIVCVGGFAKSHLQPDCLQEMIRLVKPGGVILLVYREDLHCKLEEYQCLPRIMQQYEDNRAWAKVTHERLLDYFPDEVALVLIYRVRVSEVPPLTHQ